MKDTEMDILRKLCENASELAQATTEGFVLAVTAAYLMGKETGHKEAAAQSAA